MSILAWFRSCDPPYLVNPAVLAAMATDVELREPVVHVDPVVVLDWPAEVAPAQFDWSDPAVT